MVRSALASRPGARTRSPKRWADAVPALSVVAGSSLALLPVVGLTGWWPDFGLLVLLAWRMMRADAWPSWGAAGLGLANDLLVGNPLGLSVALWTFIMLAMDVVDRRTMWRDYWVEWLLASAWIALAELAQWRVAALAGAPVRFGLVWPAVLIGTLAYPLVASVVARLDRWRLGR
jgi:rod shape-determining protein MreD